MITESKMTYQEALKVLGATGNESSAEMSKLFKRASLRNHPDRGGSTEDMQKINNAYDVVTKTGPSGARSETQGDIRARYAAQKKEWEEKLEAYYVTAKNYFSTKFNAQEFAEYFTTHTGQPTTFTHELVKGSHTVRASFKFRSGDAMFDFMFSCQPATGNGGLVAPDASALGNVSVDTDVLVGTKKHKMARREYQWGKNPDKITPESLFPSLKLKKIFSPEQKKQKYKRADYMLAFIKHLNATRNGDDNISIPVGKFTVHFGRQVMMRKGSYMFNYILEPAVNKWRPVARLKGWMMEDEEGACLDMIIDTFKELQKAQPNDAQTIVNVVEKMYAEFSAGHRSASFVKRMAAHEAAPKPEEKKKQTNRVTKEDYANAFKDAGAETRGSGVYYRFNTGAGVRISIERQTKDRKGMWIFTRADIDSIHKTVDFKGIEIPETTDGSTLPLMIDTLKGLRGIGDVESVEYMIKTMYDNFKHGRFSAPHVKKQAEQKKTPEASKDELGAQPTKPTAAKKEPAVDKAHQVEMEREAAAMNNTIRKMLGMLVKAGRGKTPNEIKEGVDEAIKLWKLTY
ncbi:hypothetical protein JC221_005 [Yersinia phage JC221]|nr:hypothetical protein JC221_005 [Yersinia phage JC221]